LIRKPGVCCVEQKQEARQRIAREQTSTHSQVLMKTDSRIQRSVDKRDRGGDNGDSVKMPLLDGAGRRDPTITACLRLHHGKLAL
jgi:hypothetical protein